MNVIATQLSLESECDFSVQPVAAASSPDRVLLCVCVIPCAHGLNPPVLTSQLLATKSRFCSII